MDPVDQGTLAGAVQEKKLLCCGSHSLEPHALQSEIGNHPFDFLKGCENMALPDGIGPQ